MSAAHATLSSRAYQHIQRKLLAGEWTAGQVISELGVAQEIGISRTPVREAIRLLEQEGVLEQVPRFGTRVKALARKDLVELYELREALEPYAVNRAAGHLRDEDAARLQMLCEEIRNVALEMRRLGWNKPDMPMMKRLMSADMAFHQLLIRAAGNGRLMKIVGEGRLLARIFMTSRQEHDLSVIEQTHGFHAGILEAVMAGDGGTAQRLMEEHIRASMKEALEHFDARQAEASRLSMDLGLPEELMDAFERMEKAQGEEKTP